MTLKIEERAAIEVRAEGKKLTGYAALYNTEARIADFSETIAPGAFDSSLADGSDILALADHRRDAVLGRTRNKTLRLSSDARGLKFELDLPDTGAGRDVAALAANQTLGGMSFGFSVESGGDEWNGEKRTLRKVTLHEVSVVSAWPAYPNTELSARARQQRTAAQRRIALLEMEAGNVAV
ncbi:HK97 family phage prohead protease [Bradyrhizobium sp. Pa8]|uniref:HK97 family phage prohead protease n=1 Tax=Bradyrhizobium sp. Pa8 TaxID=3386552 RepID=UPI00403F04EB